MPIYEYQCDQCNQTCEFLQSFSEPPKTECPNCHSQGLHRLISAAGFQLKGSGWYATDFKDKSKTTAETKSKTETIPKEDSNKKEETKSSPDSQKTESKKEQT